MGESVRKPRFVPLEQRSRVKTKRRQKVIELWDQGLSVNEIARELNISWSTIKGDVKYLKKVGKLRKLTEEEIHERTERWIAYMQLMMEQNVKRFYDAWMEHIDDEERPTLTDICEQVEVSRVTGYKYLHILMERGLLDKAGLPLTEPE